ncbi:cobyrinate a,c-diamide synthase [Sulfobacillus thermosulfidooxidans]|uniref:cobyrinate a,c-diamide synthase n=1 Tax=Sulfobacillus thermosulfidooxidans TaxID=28034 RepID=UPI0006B595AE|nr:cobyrinate a,c-diamide synthase [Sulfobacillus thermosulfidooxidans]
MEFPRLIVTAPSSGEGKTIVSLALMAALQKRGVRVQGFKVGPDYIDPSYYEWATGRKGRNLDAWMEPRPDDVLNSFVKGMTGADIAIIEGVMGYFDGQDPLTNEASTYHVAAILRAPVLLVLNGQHSARSLAAVVLGFQKFASPDYLKGVIISRIKSQRHYDLLRAAIEQETGLSCFGFLPYHENLEIEHRQLGILPAAENSQTRDIIDRLRDGLTRQLDLDRIFQLGCQAPSIDIPPRPAVFSLGSHPIIAVASDQAFNFYYPQNLELLQELGASLVFFSPLAGEKIPDTADALYIGGGFPEEFARQLSTHGDVLQHYYNRIAQGLPTLAECGGYMFLSQHIVDQSGEHHPMVGLIPHRVLMQKQLQAVGYRKITMLSQTHFPEGTVFRGHEFHYSCSVFSDSSPAYKLEGRTGEQLAGYASANVLAGYAHLYFPSNIPAIKNWIESLS